MEQSIDPRISKTKFDREIASFRKLEDLYIKRGWYLLKATFPEVFVVFVAHQLNPAPVVFGAKLDFTNYDIIPPSVRVVNPFTGVPYKAKELPEPAKLKRKDTVQNQAVQIPQVPGLMFQFQQVQQLMQAHFPEDIPFLCLPGVREYHEHPAHTGDNWLLHRGNGEGTLYNILSVLSKYGTDTIKSLNFGFNITVTGFHEEAPE